jgi:peptide deformylase
VRHGRALSPIFRDNHTMATQTILKMGDARLLRVAQPVAAFNTPELHQLLQDMQDTMTAANGAGLAAPQIAVDLQVVIFGTGQVNPRYPDAPLVPRTVLINPVITPLNRAWAAIESIAILEEQIEMEDGWEGCLSVPGLRGVVPRFARIRYQGFDEMGRVIDRVAEGFHARVVQHECDHLLGVLYPMRIKDFSQFGFTQVLFPDLADDAGDDD